MIDADTWSIFDSGETTFPHETVIDLGGNYLLNGFTYLPMQQRWFHGMPSHYAFFISLNGNTWGDPVAVGEFSNIINNPVLQRVEFAKKAGRFVKLKIVKTADEKQNRVTIAELDILTVH